MENCFAMDKILAEVKSEAENLIEPYDCFTVELGNGKALFIQVDDSFEDVEYFIELNDIDEDGALEPCADYNQTSEFGDVDKLVESVKEYLESVL